MLVDDVADALALAALHTGDELDGRALNLATRSSLLGARNGRGARPGERPRLVFHPRPLWLSQLAEVGKWLVKKLARRPDVAFPSMRDLRARALEVPFACETARELLGWTPREDAAEILAVLEEAHAPR